jgi:ABC-type multidrug transport system permease subunit
MRRIFHIALVDLKIMFKDKIFFFWTLAFPLFFILIFGNLYQNDQTTVSSELTIVNQDKGKWGKTLIEYIKNPDMALSILEEAPSDYKRMLIIPADFSDKVESRIPQKLTFKKKEAASMEAASRVEMRIYQAIAKVITEMILLSGDKSLPHAGYKDIVGIKAEFPPQTIIKTPSGFDHVIPGTMVQFIMMMVLIYGGIMVMMDRNRGILERIMFSSVTYSQLWGGKFLGRFMIGILQALILIITGKLFFNLNLGNNVLALIVVVSFCFVIASLSILIGSIINKEDLIIGLSILIANIFAALGGCWWPIEVVPQSIKTIAMLTPAYWAMDAFHKIIFFGKGFSDIILNLVVFVAYSLLFTILSIKYFKIKHK